MRSLDYVKDQPSSKSHDVSLQNRLQLYPDRQWTHRQINCRTVKAKTGALFIFKTTTRTRWKELVVKVISQEVTFVVEGGERGRKQKVIL